MMEAMAAAGQKLADQPQSFEAKDHFNQDAVQIIEAWSQFTTQMTRNAPETWLRYFKDLRTGGVSAEAKAVSSPSVTPRPQKGRNLAHRPSKRAKSA